jgi:hypothetical protein
MEGSRMTETTPQPSAEIIPFPLRRTQSWRFIAAEYARRPEKGRYDKADYAEKVISGNRERLDRLGVAQEHIHDEIAALERLFLRLGEPEKKRA